MDELIERLRYEADISARPGQMDRLNALADEFAAALADAAKPKWRTDIANAPRDGSTFLATGWDFGLVGGSRHIVFAKWSEDEDDFVEVGEETVGLRYLTHWMPLPAAPEVG